MRNIGEIEAVVKGVRTGHLPWSPKLEVGTCSETGLPKVTCQLRSPDVRPFRERLRAYFRNTMSGLNVMSGIWPPHTVRFTSHDPTDAEIELATLTTIRSAYDHEVIENVTRNRRHIVDPHPAT